jgi:hypothetical protein
VRDVGSFILAWRGERGRPRKWGHRLVRVAGLLFSYGSVSGTPPGLGSSLFAAPCQVPRLGRAPLGARLPVE